MLLRAGGFPYFILLVGASLAAFFLTARQSVHETQASTPPSVQAEISAAPSTPPVVETPPEPERTTVAGAVRRGDTVSRILGQCLTPQEIQVLSRQARKEFPLTRICVGQPYEISLLEGAFESFVYEIDSGERLLVEREGDGFRVKRVPIPYTVETEVVRGRIESSLFEAVAAIGESPELALALADIFAWDIDFILDIRSGDSFQAMIERRYREGEPAGYGRILAAEFVNQGEIYSAILFEDDSRPPSYYDTQGRSLRKAFLKAPLSFSRISSGFTQRRFHPITKTWRAHPAIDYAASPGTPIKTVGDGVISEKGYTRGNGNYVKIRHNSTYETLYLHMSRFAKGMQRGRKVSQGQIIGYVGSTGLATGPHLCFRMYKNGSPVNPLKVKSVPTDPVSKDRLAEFRANAGEMLALLRGSSWDQATLHTPRGTSLQQ